MKDVVYPSGLCRVFCPYDRARRRNADQRRCHDYPSAWRLSLNLESKPTLNPPVPLLKSFFKIFFFKFFFDGVTRRYEKPPTSERGVSSWGSRRGGHVGWALRTEMEASRRQPRKNSFNVSAIWRETVDITRPDVHRKNNEMATERPQCRQAALSCSTRSTITTWRQRRRESAP